MSKKSIDSSPISHLEDIFNVKQEGSSSQTGEISLLTEQNVSLLKESKPLFELLRDSQASETLIIILTQIEKRKPENNYNGWIK